MDLIRIRFFKHGIKSLFSLHLLKFSGFLLGFFLSSAIVICTQRYFDRYNLYPSHLCSKLSLFSGRYDGLGRGGLGGGGRRPAGQPRKQRTADASRTRGSHHARSRVQGQSFGRITQVNKRSPRRSLPSALIYFRRFKILKDLKY